MDDKKLKKILIATSIVLIVAFLVIKNFDKISFGKLESKSEELEIESSIEENELYGVSSAHSLASKVGIEVLEDGGNAADAAVAMSFALTIVDPQNSGIGGGGAMLIADEAKNEELFYDYYISSGDAEPESNNIGIPGFLKGMELINEEKGKKELSELIQYAIDLEKDGIEVTEGYAEVLDSYKYIAEVHPSFKKDGEVLKRGDLLYQPELVETLEKVRENGSDILYDGESEISQNFLEVTGISKESLNNYQVYKEEPIEVDYRGYNIMTAPAPFSGLKLLESLLMEEEIDIPEHDFEDINYNNAVKDLLKFTGQESRETIGDPRFVKINYDEELDIDYLMSKYSGDVDYDEDYEEPESATTTPFTVIDKDGMMVSGTNTLSNYWGSYVVRDGIIYNNAMKNFTTGPNKFEFNKRPKTGIAPVIISNDHSHKEVLATSGGARIPNYLFNIIVDSKKNNMEMQKANDLERIHYYKREMHFEENAPYSENENRVINYGGDYREFDASHLWGLANGLEIKENGEINGHVDKRGYFDGKYIYSNGKERISN